MILNGSDLIDVWMTIKEAAKSCSELVKCGCKLSCGNMCKCQKHSLRCTELYASVMEIVII